MPQVRFHIGKFSHNWGKGSYVKERELLSVSWSENSLKYIYLAKHAAKSFSSRLQPVADISNVNAAVEKYFEQNFYFFLISISVQNFTLCSHLSISKRILNESAFGHTFTN